MQEIIVYRNPAEAAIWDFIMNSPAAFPLMCAIFVGVGVFYVLYLKIESRRWKYRIDSRWSIAAGLVAGFATFHMLYI